jgi:hypothetical protein
LFDVVLADAGIRVALTRVRMLQSSRAMPWYLTYLVARVARPSHALACDGPL